MPQETVFIGIDLGTFKTSVAGSNGNRCVIPTAVGWPKDTIGRQMLGKDVVFGDEIAAHRQALNVVRPFKRGAHKFVDGSKAGVSDEQKPLHLKAGRLVVEFAVKQMAIDADAAVYGAIGAPSQASANNHQLILDAASSSFASLLVVHEPFAVGYGMHKLDQSLIVDIGAGTIDICPMFGAYPDASDQITIPLGGDLIDEAILQGINQHYPEAACSTEMARKFKEKYGSVADQQAAAVVPLRLNGSPKLCEITEILHVACKTIVGPIIEGIWQVVSACEPEFQKPLLDNVVLAGGGSQLAGLDHQIEAGLQPFGGGSVTRAYDSVFAGAVGALKLAMDMPREQWNRVTDQSKAA